MARMILTADLDAPGGHRYYASDAYCTLPTDTPANTLFEGRLLSVVYERAVSFAPWTRSGGGAAISEVLYINADGELDAWPTEAWRDRKIDFRLVTELTAYDDADVIGSVTVDRVETVGETRIRHVCRSALERLDKPLTSAYSQSISNEQLRGRTKPMALGRVRWMGPAAVRLRNGGTRGLYDVTDANFEDVLELRSRGGLETEYDNPAGSAGGGWFLEHDECFGFTYGTQSYRLAAEVRGNIRRDDTQLVASSDFPSGTGGAPDGWTSAEGPDGVITWNSAGSLTIDGAGTSDTYIAQTLTTVSGARYQIEIDITSHYAGVMSIWAGGSVVRNIDTAQVRVVMATFVAAGTSTEIRVGFANGAAGAATLAHVKCWRFYRIDSLAEMMRFAATRCGLSTDDLDLTAAAAIDTAAGYELAFFTEAEFSGAELLRRAAASFGVGLFQDRFGKIKPVQIAAPAAPADFTIARWQVLGGVEVEADQALGLSKRLAYGRNYAVHSEDDATNAGTAALKAELQRDWAIATSTVSLHANYSDAAEREPIETLLSESADAQAEIDRLCGLYTTPRNFYTFRVRTDDSVDPWLIEPGDVVHLTHPRHGLSGGKYLLVVLARSSLAGGAVELVAWG